MFASDLFLGMTDFEFWLNFWSSPDALDKFILASPLTRNSSAIFNSPGSWERVMFTSPLYMNWTITVKSWKQANGRTTIGCSVTLISCVLIQNSVQMLMKYLFIESTSINRTECKNEKITIDHRKLPSTHRQGSRCRQTEPRCEHWSTGLRLTACNHSGRRYPTYRTPKRGGNFRGCSTWDRCPSMSEDPFLAELYSRNQNINKHLRGENQWQNASHLYLLTSKVKDWGATERLCSVVDVITTLLLIIFTR